jgi:GNAT superfamily N-acetyltransferase
MRVGPVPEWLLGLQSDPLTAHAGPTSAQLTLSLMLSYLERTYPRNDCDAPRIHVLEVRDRTQPERLVAWILVEIVDEEQSDGGVIIEATRRLKCRPVWPEFPPPYASFSFVAKYWSSLNVVKLTGADLTGGGVFVDPDYLQGHRVGTYLMDMIVSWTRQWPGASVQPIQLLADMGEGEAGIRRNRFYEQFGIRFAYTSERKLAGASLPMLAGELVQCSSWKKNIQIHELPALLVRNFAEAKSRSDEIQDLVRVRKDLVKEITRAEKAPFRWAVRQRQHAIFSWSIAALVVLLLGKQLGVF